MPVAWLTGENARWEVIWWNRKKKHFSVMPFGNDLAGAEALYAKVAAAGKPFATLRSCNVGFPPPEKYRPYVKQMVKKERVRVRRKGRHVTRIKRTIVDVDVTPMIEVNLKGVWWCPYCRQMRKFRKQDGMTLTDRGHEYYLDGAVFCCPVCRISHMNHHVRKWNPTAQKMPFRQIKRTRARRSNGRATRRRTRKR